MSIVRPEQNSISAPSKRSLTQECHRRERSRGCQLRLTTTILLPATSKRSRESRTLSGTRADAHLRAPHRPRPKGTENVVQETIHIPSPSPQVVVERRWPLQRITTPDEKKKTRHQASRKNSLLRRQDAKPFTKLVPKQDGSKGRDKSCSRPVACHQTKTPGSSFVRTPVLSHCR